MGTQLQIAYLIALKLHHQLLLDVTYKTMNNILHKQTGICSQTLNKRAGKVYVNDFQLLSRFLNEESLKFHVSKKYGVGSDAKCGIVRY